MRIDKEDATPKKAPGKRATAGRVTKPAAPRSRNEQVSVDLLDNLPGCFYRCRNDRDWTMDYLSWGCYELTEFQPEELLGSRDHSYASLIHPDDRERVWEDVQEGLNTRRPFRSTYRIRTRSGQEKWVAEQGQGNWADGQLLYIEGFIHDITEQKRSEGALQDSERRYRALVDALPDGVVIHSEDKITFLNDAAVRMFGLQKAEEAYGRSIYEAIHPDFHEMARKRLERLRPGDVLPLVEERFMGANGRELELEASSTLFTYAEHPSVLVLLRDIAARKQAERKRQEAEVRLQETQALLQSIVANLPISVFLKDGGELRFVLWNKAGAQMVGIPEAEALNKTAYDLFPEEQASRFTRDDRRALESHAVTDVPEEQVTTRNRGLRVLHTRKIPIFDPDGKPRYLLGISEDITDRKHAERVLYESEERYHTLFSLFPDPLFLETLGGQVLDCNAAACRQYGYTREEMLTLRVEDLTPQGVHTLLPEVQARLQSGETFVMAEGKRKDGSVFPSEVTASPMHVGLANIVLVHVRDITERRRAEEERRKLESQILQAQKLECLGVLAGGIAHDFNNLLTAILGYADLAEAELPPEASARYSVHQITQTARRAAELTRQMLAYSGRGKLSVKPIELSKVVEEMAHLLEVSISKKCALRFNFAKSLPAVDADVAQIRQVVMNLIINASEAIGEASGIITVTTGVMHCDRAYLAETFLDENLAAGSYVFLEVSDTGCGMDPETRSRIFDPFFTTKFTGRGLGLGAVLGIVRGHRGAVKVYSEPGQGSSFKVLLPASKNVPVESPLPEEGPASAWQGSGTILVADDEDMVRSLVRRMLAKAGFTVLLARDGVEAVELFRAHADSILLVLLDLTMPRMGGEEAFREIRRLRPDARVLLTSGYNEQDITARFVGKGLAGFVQKPYIASELLEVVRGVIEGEPRSGEM